MMSFLKNIFTDLLKIYSSFFIYFLFFIYFESVNNKITDFEIRSGKFRIFFAEFVNLVGGAAGVSARAQDMHREATSRILQEFG
jgi:hypothetical protein